MTNKSYYGKTYTCRKHPMKGNTIAKHELQGQWKRMDETMPELAHLKTNISQNSRYFQVHMCILITK